MKTQSLENRFGNPFADSQARNYSDERVVGEFCPISQFWTLFNDQHEVIIGARGCGKTILLKMMRYSMLRELKQKRAQEIIKEKKYISFYVPLHLEFIKRVSNAISDESRRVEWFRFSFNCVLALSIITELKTLLEDEYNVREERLEKEIELTHLIKNIWRINNREGVNSLRDLRNKVLELYYNTDPFTERKESIPPAFMHTTGACLSSIEPFLCDIFHFSPTWIVCVDEAEFLDECYQKVINTAFRADTSRIAFKVATLPYYHTTKKTIDDKIEVMNGQDFIYTIIDLKFDSKDYTYLTDAITKSRMAKAGESIDKLEQFVETLPVDIYQEYYKAEVGEAKGKPDNLFRDILNQLPEKIKKRNQSREYHDIKKPLVNKYAPIFYIREMNKLIKGHHQPCWYAGASMIRRISQGNPRLFIRIMNALFENNKTNKIPIPMKKQHQIIVNFADSFCKETEALENVGPDAKRYLDNIARIIQHKTHDGEMTLTGLAFTIDEKVLCETKTEWLEKAVAFSRIKTDGYAMTGEITSKTVFELSNIYAANYWLPMRAKPIMQIERLSMSEDENKIPVNMRKKRKKTIPGQIRMNIEDIGI